MLNAIRITNKKDEPIQYELEVYKNGEHQYGGNNQVPANATVEPAGELPSGRGSYVAILENVDGGSSNPVGAGPSHNLNQFSIVFTITRSGNIESNIE